jgi:hypothetical protein
MQLAAVRLINGETPLALCVGVGSSRLAKFEEVAPSRHAERDGTAPIEGIGARARLRYRYGG